MKPTRVAQLTREISFLNMEVRYHKQQAAIWRSIARDLIHQLASANSEKEGL
jgi:hypothetical protein